ncbi:gTPase, IMAP member 8 [Entomortierella chlamydospora]|uniref:GTPase, IMAP member 8 n=1 Tax=Entomortierella chlamydospora TaxID=101097 RepID=A0A9P6MUJ4_9FUNG|nr:gTPase, IMAP member 8 [Entomortierella chlamydospora]
MTRQNGTKVVLVMGITGAGKSYLIKDISGSDNVKIGHNLESCTQVVENIQCQIGDQSVLILDTPGFDDTNRSDTEILADIAESLVSLYKADCKISGIIYLHNITDTRMRGSSVTNLKMFAKLCGEQSYRNVVMLTGRWGSMELSDAVEKENELKWRFWKEYIDAGCQLDRYRDRNDLVRIFESFLQKPPVVLDIQREIVDEGKTLDKTIAGEYVNHELENEKKRIEKELAEIAAEYNDQNEQMKGLMDEDRSKLELQLEKLQAEKLVMMDSHRLAEEASKAGMLNQLQELEQNWEQQRIEYERSLERAMAEKDERAREKAKLEAVEKRLREERNYREEKKGFISRMFRAISNVMLVAAETVESPVGEYQSNFP